MNGERFAIVALFVSEPHSSGAGGAGGSLRQHLWSSSIQGSPFSRFLAPSQIGFPLHLER